MGTYLEKKASHENRPPAPGGSLGRLLGRVEQDQKRSNEDGADSNRARKHCLGDVG